MAGRSALQAQMIVGDRYRLLHRIGADAAVETWEAHDARLDRPVAVRLLANDAQPDPAAHAQLHEVARESSIAGADSAAPRVLDGGDDPNYGPFVVAELNAAFEATRRIPTVDPPPTSAPPSVPPAAIAPRAAGRKTSGLVALALVLLAICALVGVVYAARSLTPAAVPAPTAAPAAAPPTSAPPATRAATPRATSAPPTTAPAAAPATAAPARTTPPTSAPVPAAAAGNPVETIKQHYALIDAHRYTESYQLMDARLRAENSQAVYESWFAGKVSLKPVSVDLVSQNAQQATVRATVLSTDTVNGRNVTSRVTEQFVLRPENGAWRIDTVTRLDQQPADGATRGSSGNRNEDNGD